MSVEGTAAVSSVKAHDPPLPQRTQRRFWLPLPSEMSHSPRLTAPRVLQDLIPLPSFAEDPIIQSCLKADTFLKVSDKVSAAQNEEGLRGLQSPAEGEQVQGKISPWEGVSLEICDVSAISLPPHDIPSSSPPTQGPKTLRQSHPEYLQYLLSMVVEYFSCVQLPGHLCNRIHFFLAL